MSYSRAMSTTYFYLLRHATDRTLEQVDKLKWPLTNEGQLVSAKIASSLKDLGINRIETCPSRMCEETILPLSELTHIKYEIFEVLADRKITSKYRSSFSKSFKKTLQRMDLIIDGTTSGNETLSKLTTHMRERATDNPGCHILMCTHLQNMALIYRSVCKEVPDFESWGRPHLLVFKIDNGVIEFNGANLSLGS